LVVVVTLGDACHHTRQELGIGSGWEHAP